MTPTSLVTTLVHERGFSDAIELPTDLLFDHTWRVTLSEPLSGQLALECMLDSALSGSHPLLATKLLQWNRDPRAVGTGAFALDANNETLHYRVVVPASSLDVEQFKEILHAFLDRVARLSTALLIDPLSADEQFTNDGELISAAHTLPPSVRIIV